MKVKVYAKLNLTLDVLGVENGYHNIDGIITSVNVFDEVEVNVRRDGKIVIDCCVGVPFEDNTAYKAADLFKRRFGTSGVDIHIKKGIPFSSGLGGSSADAAAAVYCMCKLFGAELKSKDVFDICASVGSDVNFMLLGGLGRIGGKGDNVVLYETPVELYFALTTFDYKISSKTAYGAFDKGRFPFRNADNDGIISLLKQGKTESAISLFCNRLQEAVASVSGYAEEYLDFAASFGLKPIMTGSGSAYYIAFDSLNKADKTAALLRRNGFKTLVCKNVSVGIEEII